MIETPQLPISLTQRCRIVCNSRLKIQPNKVSHLPLPSVLKSYLDYRILSLTSDVWTCICVSLVFWANVQFATESVFYYYIPCQYCFLFSLLIQIYNCEMTHCHLITSFHVLRLSHFIRWIVSMWNFNPWANMRDKWFCTLFPRHDIFNMAKPWQSTAWVELN